MLPTRYENFDLQIERHEGGYRARVRESPGGQSKSLNFQLPFTETELEKFLLRISPRRGVRSRAIARADEEVKTFGGQLYTAVFREQVQDCYLTSLNRVQDGHAGLRIRLRLSDCPDLADLPWEYLYEPEQGRFLCLSIDTPLVRFLELPEPVRALKVTPPLRMLVVIANPKEPYVDQLNADREWKNLNTTLDGLKRSGQIEVDRLDPPTLSKLDEQLRRRQYHMLHFIGHGHFDDTVESGELLFEDGNGRGSPITGHRLGVLLYDHRSLRLAVLNACDGARTGRADPFAGVAQALVRQRIPAVVAMQFEITDAAAITFAHVLYEMLATGDPIDRATAHARKAIFAANNHTEWATPVLYLRAPDGQIFDVTATPAEQRPLTPERTEPVRDGAEDNDDAIGTKPEPAQLTPSWRAELISTASGRFTDTVVRLTLTEETHTVFIRDGFFQGTLGIDDRVLAKGLSVYQIYTVFVSDGPQRRAVIIRLSTTRISSFWVNWGIAELTVDGQQLIRAELEPADE